MRWCSTWLFVLLVLGCGSSRHGEPAPSPATVSEAPVQAPPAPTPTALPARFACATDADCTNTCLYGAVNAVWYAHVGDPGCEDGCDSRRVGEPTCFHGACVARDDAGERLDACTALEVAPHLPSGQPVAGRFACASDADCMNSCNFGAVSAAWYRARSRDECDDGCEGWGASAPRCFAGLCIARNGGNRQDGCTLTTPSFGEDPSD